MWSEVKHHLFLTLSKNHGVGKSRKTRANFDGSAPSVIQNTVFKAPSINIPRPACNWAINLWQVSQNRILITVIIQSYKGGPKEYKDHRGNQTAPLSNSTNNNRGRRSTELKLAIVSFPTKHSFWSVTHT